MPYDILATSKTPALIVYLLDVSASMQQDCGGRPRIDVCTDALHKIAVKMVQRSTRGTRVAPRYRVAMLAYSSQVIDLLGGVKTIDQLAGIGVPRLMTLDQTDTAAAFSEAERVLEAELPNLQDCPAPLVCHITDGEYNGADPIPIAKRIMEMSVPDGNVLIENIYVTTGGLQIPDVHSWPGITSDTGLPDPYSKTLFQMSSTIPSSYRDEMLEYEYQLDAGARMFFPGDQPDLIELAFTLSGVTPVT
jgi:hypothetical protein